MRIYLMRHAEAVEPAAWVNGDRTRPLTPLGVARLEMAVEHMRRLRLSADILLTSPCLRAAKTAEILAEQLHVIQMVQCPELAPGARVSAFVSLVKRYAKAETLWFVGHMPEVSSFSSRLTGDPHALEEAFQPSELLAVDCDVENGELKAGTLLWRRQLEDWPTASA